MKKTAFDAADIRILSAIQQYGVLSKSKLAELVNLSPTACWGRLNNLRKAGLIKGYHADIAVEQIAEISKIIVTISLANHRKSDFDLFEGYIQKLDEIVDCVATGGGMDYVMTVVSVNLQAFQELMEELLMAELGIERYMTYIVTREIKSVPPNLNKLITPRLTK
ncbi:Lrp/AsnC family transcriptional regulator [Curvivirga aplysinae]|uniref:Lrp/AsnC family transcriptional regulator n=1 Tax=Curvivirga aplysinae TaxID=2529852 RepID=UPI0012BCF901|nr:Lrp/AsnC family transcriptional regulator [Curvivirga aplysinae]MTI09797.1 Lrp/AsnC family transcriptional regulator [Curvivirga aplysinae]